MPFSYTSSIEFILPLATREPKVVRGFHSDRCSCCCLCDDLTIFNLLLSCNSYHRALCYSSSRCCCYHSHHLHSVGGDVRSALVSFLHHHYISDRIRRFII